MGASNADYERQFKEIVAKAKAVYGTGTYDDSTLEFLIPELRESEDERIRKLLVWQVYRNIEDETNDLAQSVYDGIKGHDPDIEESIEDWKKCLAWLEKQKDINCLACDQHLKGYIAGRKATEEEKQKEQKPIFWTELTWKDIVELEGIINNVHYDFSAGIGQESFGKEVLERFRSKKDNAEIDACEQKPADGKEYSSPECGTTAGVWSEEDERKRQACITTINEVIDYERERWEDYNPGKPYRPIMKYDEQIDWLKSLPMKCPKTSDTWKPSEEQLEALEYVCRVYPSGGAEKSLYNNLKKLCEQLQELI